jgi:hypothetical protein
LVLHYESPTTLDPSFVPIADAGLDLFVQEGDIVTLYGGGSNDLDENIYSYTWYQSAGDPIVTLNDADTPTPSFVAPSKMIADTTLQFELIITDKEAATCVFHYTSTSQYKVELFIACTFHRHL